MVRQPGDTVYIVDDDKEFLDLVVLYVKSAGYHARPCNSAEEFLAVFDPLQAACILLDVYMPNMTGLDLLRKLVALKVQTPVVMMTAYGDVATAVKAMKAGSADYIEKPLDQEQLLERIHECRILDSVRRGKAARQNKYTEYLAKLTSREYEVMEKMAAGKMNKVIAAELGISQRTVEEHRAKIMEKLQAASLADVVRIYLLSQT